jgi:asparagine synthase (glutamine-hydrolysing)
MAHGLEVREPLMDHTLVEWLASLSPDLKLNRGEGKYILKKALEPYLPDGILYRPKMGFAVPLTKWFRGPLRQAMKDAVLGPVLANTGWFNASYLQRLVEDHESGRRDYSAPLWTLMMFESFLRKVMGVQTAPKIKSVA